MNHTQQNLILVTGASGFIGRNICQKLLKNGFAVRCHIRKPDPSLNRMGAETIISTEIKTNLTAALEGCTAVIHCAGNAQFGNGKHYRQDNLDPVSDLIEAINKTNRDIKLIFMSSIGAVDRAPNDKANYPLTETSPCSPSSDYGKSKHEAEKLIINSGLNYTILRPSMVVGAGMRPNSHFNYFTKNALKNNILTRFKLSGRFSIIHVDDLSNAVHHCFISKKTNQKIFFCSGEPISLGDFWELVAPNKMRIPLFGLKHIVSFFSAIIPFKLKSLFLDMLVADDTALQNTGWKSTVSAREALATVIKHQKMRFDLSIAPHGKTVITGAASGLGRSIALKICNNREDVLLIDKDEAGLTELQKKIPHANIFICDLSNEAEISALVGSEKWANNSISELFACAGIGFRGLYREQSIEDTIKTFDVNLKARLMLLSACLNDMRRHFFGRVLFISSSSAFQPLPMMATYAASNSAILSFAEAVSSEVNDDQITVFVACPGGMKTNFQASAGVKVIENENLMHPDDVADKIIKKMGKNKATIVISLRSHLMALFARLMPREVNLALWKFLMGKMR